MVELARRPLGSAEILVSELCLGSATFGSQADEATSASIIDRYISAGGNFLDTADVYNGGRAEEIIGRAVRRRRGQIVLGAKGGMASEAAVAPGGGTRMHLTQAVEASLRRLQTDWIDLYQLHLPDPNTPLPETLAALDELVCSGKVRHIGVSNFAGWQLASALGVSAHHGWTRFEVLQAQYSLISRDVELDLIPLCKAEGLSLLAWAPLGGGVLSGKYTASSPAEAGTRMAETPQRMHPLTTQTMRIVDALKSVALAVGHTPAQVALRWLLQRPAMASVIVGARTVEQLDNNLGIAGWTLDEAHLLRLTAASEPRYPYPHDLQRALGARPLL